MAIKKFFVGVKGVIRNNNQILMVRGVNGRDFWDFPGGRIDDDELIIDTLQRELREELPNLKTYQVGELLGAQRVQRNIEEDISLVLVFFEVKDAVFDGDISLSDEHTQFAWRNREDITEDEATSPAIRAVVRQLTD